MKPGPFYIKLCILLKILLHKQQEKENTSVIESDASRVETRISTLYKMSLNTQTQHSLCFVLTGDEFTVCKNMLSAGSKSYRTSYLLIFYKVMYICITSADFV